MKARCICTMEPMGENSWRKPDGGYRKPDANCRRCRGKGFISVAIRKPRIWWDGICPKCGVVSAGHLQYGLTDEPSDEHEYICPNPPCESARLRWRSTREN